MYAKCMVEDTKRTFEVMDSSDVGCWNSCTMWLQYRCGYGLDHIIGALNGYLCIGDLNVGSQIPGLAIISGKLTTLVVNSIIKIYFNHWEKRIAIKLFHTMVNVVVSCTWNTVFAGSSEDIAAMEIVDLFHNMLGGMKPNHVTLAILFRLWCYERTFIELNLGFQFYSIVFYFGLHLQLPYLYVVKMWGNAYGMYNFRFCEI